MFLYLTNIFSFSFLLCLCCFVIDDDVNREGNRDLSVGTDPIGVDVDVDKEVTEYHTDAQLVSEKEKSRHRCGQCLKSSPWLKTKKEV